MFLRFSFSQSFVSIGFNMYSDEDASNGGYYASQDFSLTPPGSRLSDQVVPSTPLFDFRGQSRVGTVGTDLGASFVPSASPFVLSPSGSAGASPTAHLVPTTPSVSPPEIRPCQLINIFGSVTPPVPASPSDALVPYRQTPCTTPDKSQQSGKLVGHTPITSLRSRKPVLFKGSLEPLTPMATGQTIRLKVREKAKVNKDPPAPTGRKKRYLTKLRPRHGKLAVTQWSKYNSPKPKVAESGDNSL